MAKHELQMNYKKNDLNKMKKNSIDLGSICDTFQGLITGNNDAFIVTNKQADIEKLEKIMQFVDAP